MSAETRKIVLGIDSPGDKWETPFRAARKVEVPKEKDPLFTGPLDNLLTTYIVVRSPDDGAKILNEIRQQWSVGDGAWASQHLPTDDEVIIQIVGLTVVSEAPGEWIFRIYTPPEEYVSE